MNSISTLGIGDNELKKCTIESEYRVAKKPETKNDIQESGIRIKSSVDIRKSHHRNSPIKDNYWSNTAKNISPNNESGIPSMPTLVIPKSITSTYAPMQCKSAFSHNRNHSMSELK